MATPVFSLNSQNHWIADGATTVWNFTFADGYISRDYVKAYSIDPTGIITERVLSFIGDFQVSVSPAVPDGHRFVIYRDTPKGSRLVDYATGSRMTEADMDLANKQSLHIAAEAYDALRFLPGGTGTAINTFVALSDASTANLPGVNLPLAAALAGKETAGVAASEAASALAAAGALVDDLRLDLSSAVVTEGAGMVKFSAEVNYAIGTLGRAVADRSVSITDIPWSCVSGTDCGAAIQAANDFLVAAGGGVLVFPKGEWRYSTNLTRGNNVTWRGTTSLGAKLKCLNDTAQLFHTGARGGIEDLYIEGSNLLRAARIAAPATNIGVVDNGATTWMRNVRIKYFKVGHQQKIGYWKEYTKVWTEECGVGMDFNASGSDFSNLLTFYSCTWRQNDRGGIAASGTPVNNNVINFFGCDVESNCGESPTTYPQIAMLNARVVNWVGGYGEANGVVPAPDFWNLQNTSVVSIDGIYMSGCRKAFFSGSNGSGQVEIKRVYWAGGTSLVTSHAYDFPSCTAIAVTDYNTHTAAIVLDGPNSYLINKKLAQQETISWTPGLFGSTVAGTPVPTSAVGRAVRIGNFVHFSGRISVSSLGGMTGNVRISLPTAHETVAGLFTTCVVEATGVTPTAGKTYFTGRIGSGTNYIELMENGNAAGTQAVASTALAASTTLIFSGAFPITV